MKPMNKVQTKGNFIREYVRGHVRSDGKVFDSYRTIGEKVYERWCSPDQLTVKRARINKGSRAWAQRPENKVRMSKLSSECQKRRRKQAPEMFLVTAAKGRAKKTGLPFDITASDIKVPEVCPVLGLRLEIGEGACKDNSPSIDRFVPELGYVKGNVRVISRRANRIKNDATPDELHRVWLYSIGML